MKHFLKLLNLEQQNQHPQDQVASLHKTNFLNLGQDDLMNRVNLQA